MTMGLSVNECLHSKKPENEIDLLISSIAATSEARRDSGRVSLKSHP